jgi:hypothetical protein
MDKDPERAVHQRRHLTPEEKYQIFIEATMDKAQGNGSVGDVMRRCQMTEGNHYRVFGKIAEKGIR